jgi:Zn-dependent protease
MMMSKMEKKELVKAWLATSLAFGIIIYGSENSFIFSIAVAACTVGLGFMLHELAHRALARKMGKHAEFRANNSMLILAILMSFFGFIIAAPGAVHISGFGNRKQIGMTASAGPLTNLVLAILFIPFIWVIPKIAFYGFMINAWMGLFNLIPMPGFDGQKIIEWSKPAYFAMAALALALNLLNIILPNFMNI